MLTQQDVDKLLNAVYYNGEYAVKYHEQNDDGTFNINNEYLGFTTYDDDGFLNIHTSSTYIVVYEALTAYPPRQELLSILETVFPDKRVEVKCDKDDDDDSCMPVYEVMIHF